MTRKTPETIGRYRVERLLGAGAMGYVYLATDPELDRLVAIKTLRDLSLDDDALQVFLERFRNEARAAARLHHPGIVQVYDVGDDDTVGPYLVFEYVPGSTLKKLIRSRGPLSPDDVVLLAEQVGDALDFAHESSVIHRDIKPENLLVTEYGETKLADFGVARIPNAALTREGQFLGTPCYAAPETLSDGHYGPQTDLFSFAAVLYEAATGERAFPGEDALSVAHKVVHDDPLPPSSATRRGHVPPSVDDVLLQALSKNPKARPASAQELADALRAAYAAAELLTQESEGRLSVSGAAQRRRESSSGGWFAPLLLLALALGGVALVWQISSPTVDLPDAGPNAGPDAGSDAGPDAGSGPEAGALGAVGAEDGGPTDAAEPIDATLDNLDAGDAAGDADDLSHDAGTDAIHPSEDAAAGDEEHPPAEQGRGALSGDPEELAKDAVARARELIAVGRFRAAREALERARRYDPGLDEIGEVEAQLRDTP